LKGPLPLKQALECGVQICDALEKAHRAGIVHRDLKPGNIMLTASGAKLLDFGLAKSAAAMFGAQALSDRGNLTPSTPTLNLSVLGAHPGTLTQQGTIVGTFQFMAPEVLQGQEADARSDIFSFGCVLYEMITGRRAFEGKSQISVASAILEKDPELISKVQPMAPAALDHVVHDCLAKDPEARWQNAADVARQLRWIARGGASSDTTAPAPVRSPWRERWLWGAVVAALLAILGWSNLRSSAPARALRSYLPPPAETGFDFTGDFSGPPAIAPDGTAVAFCARGPKGQDTIWVQSFSDLAAKKLEGTEGASFPFWSADAKFLAFFADGHLKKVSASGGPVTVLADAPNARGGLGTRTTSSSTSLITGIRCGRSALQGECPRASPHLKRASTRRTAGRCSCPTANIFCSSRRATRAIPSRAFISGRWRMVLTSGWSTRILNPNMAPVICSTISSRS